MIAVTGSIQTRNYEDRQGNKRKAFEIVASDVSFTGSKRESGSAGVSSYESAPAPGRRVSEPPRLFQRKQRRF